jgi:hypothetical protein
MVCDLRRADDAARPQVPQAMFWGILSMQSLQTRQLFFWQSYLRELDEIIRPLKYECLRGFSLSSKHLPVSEVTLVTQCSVDRLSKLEELAMRYVSDSHTCQQGCSRVKVMLFVKLERPNGGCDLHTSRRRQVEFSAADTAIVLPRECVRS